ncbi:Ran-binding protein 1 c [Glycine soja]
MMQSYPARALDRRLQVDWARDAREDPKGSKPQLLMSSADLKHKEEEEELVVGDDKDTRAYVAPIVKLQKVAITTGEEDEDPILDLKSKLYRFDKDENQWKERGADTMKFLKHKASGKVRLLIRQSKMLKIYANQLIFESVQFSSIGFIHDCPSFLKPLGEEEEGQS